MATNNPNPPINQKRRRFRSRQDRYRDEVMREWLGVDPAQDSNNGVLRVSALIDSVLKKVGVGDGLELDEVKSAWEELAGPFIARHSHPFSVSNGHLVLRVSQPVMRFQLEQMRGVLLRQLQERLGAKHVKSVKFQVG